MEDLYEDRDEEYFDANEDEGLTSSRSTLLMCIPCSISAQCVTSPTRTTASLTFSKVVLTAEETRVYQIPWEKQQRKLQKKQQRSLCFCWCCVWTCLCKPVNNRMTRKVSSNDMRKRTACYKNIIEQKRPTVEQIQKWGCDFEALISDDVGQKLFYLFLQTEHSEENLQFWKDVNMLRELPNNKEKQYKIKCIYKEYIKPMALKEVNIAGNTRKQIEEAIENKPCETMFDGAQAQVYLLMHRQSYPRFVSSDLFHSVLQNTYAYDSVSPNATVPVKKSKNSITDNKHAEKHVEKPKRDTVKGNENKGASSSAISMEPQVKSEPQVK